jgi:hypothetical protein
MPLIMAKKNSNTLLLLLGLGGVAYWLYSKSNQPAAAIVQTSLPGASLPIALPAPMPTVSAPVPTILVTGGTNSAAAPVQAPAPAPLQPAPVATQAISITDPRYDTIQQWANSALNAPNLAQFNKMRPLFTQADWNGLFDLYFNGWIGGQGITPARDQFWSYWRTTYHIDDGTWPNN